jgi:hypothetical protein
MMICLPNPHNQIKEFFPIPLDAWLTLAMPFPTTFPLNLGWKMLHFVPTFNGAYNHTFKKMHTCNYVMNTTF